MNTFSKIARDLKLAIVASALVALPALTGCVTTGGGSAYAAYNRPSDPCNVHRTALTGTQEDLEKWAWQGAGIGAGAGAILGALIGGDVGAAALGAAAGAVVGGSVGYLEGRRRNTDTREELVSAIDVDAGADSAKVRQFAVALHNLWDCRQDEVDLVIARHQEGTLTRAEAMERANDIQRSVREDEQLVAKILGTVDERYRTYVDAKAEVLELEQRQVTTQFAEAPTVTLEKSVATYELESASGVYVTRRAVNIRRAPRVEDGNVIATLPANSRVNVTGRTQNSRWYAFPHGGQVAFVYANLLDEDGPKDSIEQLAAAKQEAQSVQAVGHARTERKLEALDKLLS